MVMLPVRQLDTLVALLYPIVLNLLLLGIPYILIF